MELRGVFSPLVTPFLEGGALDLPSFERNLEDYARFDLSGYLVLGSNGETPSLDEDEKLALVRSARERSRGRTLLVGTGLESTAATIALTRRVADLGADAALVLTPHYYRAQMTRDVLLRHFDAVADASPIPVLAYSVPQFTGLPFPAGLGRALSSNPRIVGIKESSGDLSLLGGILSSVPSSFRVLCGSMSVFYPALCLGASGGVLAMACCAPGAVQALYRAFLAQDHARCLALQRALQALSTAASPQGVAALKLAVTLAGFQGGSPRLPLPPAPKSLAGELKVSLSDVEAAASA